MNSFIIRRPLLVWKLGWFKSCTVFMTHCVWILIGNIHFSIITKRAVVNNFGYCFKDDFVYGITNHKLENYDRGLIYHSSLDKQKNNINSEAASMILFHSNHYCRFFI